jgi:L-threonylcarbamoyladenylate synthase
MCLDPPANIDAFAAVEALSEKGNLREAAANLYAALRRLDGFDLDFILALPVPETGLGLAITDRLRKASRPMASVLAQS